MTYIHPPDHCTNKTDFYLTCFKLVVFTVVLVCVVRVDWIKLYRAATHIVVLYTGTLW